MRALFRLSRAAAVACATVWLAAAAHTTAAGSLPDPLILAAVLALALLPAVALAGRKISAPAMLAVLSAGQVALHEAFDVLSVSASTPPLPTPVTGHVHVLGALSAPGAGGQASGHTATMLFAHVLATVVTALLLARGEAALWALLAWLRPLVRILTPLALHPTPAVPAFTDDLLPRSWRGLRLPARRGPPAAFAVV